MSTSKCQSKACSTQILRGDPFFYKSRCARCRIPSQKYLCSIVKCVVLVFCTVRSLCTSQTLSHRTFQPGVDTLIIARRPAFFLFASCQSRRRKVRPSNVDSIGTFSSGLFRFTISFFSLFLLILPVFLTLLANLFSPSRSQLLSLILLLPLSLFACAFLIFLCFFGLD